MSIEERHTALEFSSLMIGYPSLDLILDARGTVAEGELIALAGRNGSGKSTLLRVLAGLDQPLAGTVFVHGRPISAFSSHGRARALSFVSTGISSPENMTVFELVSLGRYPHTGWWGNLSENDRDIVDRSLEAVNLESYAGRLVNRLSDGERQRVMIARALAQNGDLILLDEPTAFLDLPARFEVIHLLYQLSRQGKSIIYSTHDIEAAWTYSDKLWLIHGNRLHEGSPEDLGLSGLYNDLFKSTPVKLDTRTMRFRSERKVTGEIGLLGEDRELLRWTKVALNRAGFNTVSGVETGTVAECRKTLEGNQWLLKKEGYIKTFRSLYELICFLTRV